MPAASAISPSCPEEGSSSNTGQGFRTKSIFCNVESASQCSIVESQIFTTTTSLPSSTPPIFSSNTSLQDSTDCNFSGSLKRPDLKGNFRCSICQKIFCHSSSLSRHRMQAHFKCYTCTICRKQINKTIESTWQKFKRHHKYEYGTHRSVFRSYISDFVWRKKFSGNDITYCLWSQIESSMFFHV
uniref:C2H2-type domain-containing protein n=1 Tax=Ditylenchus dipsaci TaxID=166011 RepID=A0A915DQ12_9BILA